MIFDWDDVWPGQDPMPRLNRLKELRPDFRCTLFASPGRADDSFWNSFPDWCELAVHGWHHPDAHECQTWTYGDMEWAIDHKPERFVEGFKAPGWQISDECYEALEDHGWWVADQHLEDYRRPKALRAYFYEDGPDRWHGHVQNVCGNGLEETWSHVVSLVERADGFGWCSEAAG